jgi:hypothetical protein
VRTSAPPLCDQACRLNQRLVDVSGGINHFSLLIFLS